MAIRRVFWAPLTMLIALTASCGTTIAPTPDGGAQGGGGVSTSAMSTGAGGAGGMSSGSSSSGTAGAGGAGGTAGACGPNLPLCDDTNPCTLDACDPATLKCAFTPLMQGASCNVSGGKVCDGNGACVACNIDADCTGKTDECQHPACTNHTCLQVYTPANTPLSPAFQTPGDCHVVVCDGAGNTKNIPDDTDIKDDANPCTSDICMNGIAMHPLVPPGTPCGLNGVCNNTGSCELP